MPLHVHILNAKKYLREPKNRVEQSAICVPQISTSRGNFCYVAMPQFFRPDVAKFSSGGKITERAHPIRPPFPLFHADFSSPTDEHKSSRIFFLFLRETYSSV